MEKEKKSTIWEWLDDLPIGLYFIILVLALAYVQLQPIGLGLPITTLTRASYDQMNSLESGDIVLFDQGYGTGSLPIHEPGFVVGFKHAMAKGLKIVIVSTSVEGPMLFERALMKIDPARKGYEYGKDYIHLGYVAGAEAAIAAMLEDITKVFTADYQGTPLDQLELADRIKGPTYEKISLLWILSGGSEVMEGWIRQGSVRYELRQIGDYLEMDTPIYIPYYPVLLQGIINGGIGAAEYEVLSGFAGEAAKLTDGLSIGHFVILIFLIIGNIGYLMKDKEKR